MNLHTITSCVTIAGFLFTVYCIVEAEVCYRQVSRYLKENAAKRAAANDQDDGS